MERYWIYLLILGKTVQPLENMSQWSCQTKKNQLFIPRGFAHGFVVLSANATFAYKVDNYYSYQCDRGLSFDDPALTIDWLLPKNDLQLSKKDTRQQCLSELSCCFNYNTDYYA